MGIRHRDDARIAQRRDRTAHRLDRHSEMVGDIKSAHCQIEPLAGPNICPIREPEKERRQSLFCRLAAQNEQMLLCRKKSLGQK